MVRFAEEQFGRLDIVFNNAGVGVMKPFVELQPDAALTKLVSLLPDAVDAERALSVVQTVAGPVEEMEERTITMFARMREALGCEKPLRSASSEAA